MLKYVTSLLLFISVLGFAQRQGIDTTTTISTANPKQYGLRVGIDLASLIRTGLDDEYTGFQVLGDYRLSNRLYAAGELGNETLDRNIERIDYKTSGSFIKVGLDYNFYQNWLEMDNMIYGGVRLGYANMSQELSRYEYNNDNNYFPTRPVFEEAEFTGLSALWLEIQMGIKVEVLNNLYLMASLQLRRSVVQTTPDNFDNLFIPGYGRTYDTNEIGAGYTWGIQYRIPLFKK
jgi:hypothetical protein